MRKTLLIKNKGESFYRFTDTAVTLMARDWKGYQTYPFNAVIIKKEHKNEDHKLLDRKSTANDN